MSRAATASALWPDVTEAQAHGNLRSALWRLDKATREGLRVNVLEIELTDAVAVDLHESTALARRLLIVDTEPSESDLSSAAIKALSSDLVPDWYDDWAIVAAENWRQLRMHALELLAAKLSAIGRFADAIEAARAAVEADPLRESSRAALIRVHLAEGNQSEALTAFASYRELLRTELGLEPTAALLALVSDLRST